MDQKLINKNGEKVFETPKSRSSVRIIKIGETLMAILKSEKERQKQFKEEYQEHYCKQADYVCCDDLGFPVSQSALIGYCVRLKKRTGIDFNFHLLRHTHATMGKPCGSFKKIRSFEYKYNFGYLFTFNRENGERYNKYIWKYNKRAVLKVIALFYLCLLFAYLINKSGIILKSTQRDKKVLYS